MKMSIKLSKWAKSQGISYQTAWRWFTDGKISNARQVETGTVLVDIEENTDKIINSHDCVIYCRVSSYEKKNDLLRQVERCNEFASANGWRVRKVYKEIASGMNDNRKELNRLIEEAKNAPCKVVVENKDRLTRFGFNYLDILFHQINCLLVPINTDTDDEKDLMKDFISVITSFCCRLYGLRRSKNKVDKIKKLIETESNLNSEK